MKNGLSLNYNYCAFTKQENNMFVLIKYDCNEMLPHGFFCFAVLLLLPRLIYIPQPVSVKMPRIMADFTINPTTKIVLEGSGLENRYSSSMTI